MKSGNAIKAAVLFALASVWPVGAAEIDRGVEGNPRSVDGVWEFADAVPRVAAEPEPWVQPAVFKGVVLEANALANVLNGAPMEFTPEAQNAPVLFHLPMPDGTYARFWIEESPVMEPALAAQYPEIKTYRGRGIDDPAASLRMDSTPAGFHAQVLTPRGSVYVDPYWKGNTSFYASYYKRDLARGDRPFQCLTEGTDELGEHGESGTSFVMTGETLRTYRLACAATGEYTQFHGGTVAAGLAAIVTAVNRVSGIYEVEVSVRMVLVANNNLIVYTSGGSDPYTNNDGFSMLGQNQTTCNNVIGSANYDIGHVFSTGGGGVASLASVCKSNKAQGVTGLPSPIGDAFYVDYVAHEMGHQFGGNHCFNGTGGSCSGGNRNGSTAYEPGSGSTIMAYAGICGADNLQPNSDAYFHFINLQEIINYTQTGTGNSCDVPTSTGNTPPTIEAGVNYAIPKGTPFALTAVGDDVDGDTVSYCWEERDLGAAQALSAADNGLSPLMRSFSPNTNPTRTFPRLSNILSGVNSNQEKLPNLNRTMKFRVTARDNRAGGGGVSWDDMQLTVDGSSAAFAITQPAQGVTWSGTRTVQWVVGNTAGATINTSQVNILLSTDGGNTFPTTLASGTANDGSEIVSLPDLASATARIKVEPVGNVYFAISRGFILQGCNSAVGPSAEPGGVLKNRYVSFLPPVTTGAPAIRVTLVDLPPPYDAFNGETRWVGAPVTYGVGPASFKAAPLQCTPHFANWTGLGVIHVYGAEIIPGSEYDIQSVECDPQNESNFSAPLTVATTKYGDVRDPFHPMAGQPDFLDISAVVTAFQGGVGSIGKVRAQMQPNSANPANPVGFLDVSEVVNAFQGDLYMQIGPSSCE